MVNDAGTVGGNRRVLVGFIKGIVKIRFFGRRRLCVSFGDFKTTQLAVAVMQVEKYIKSIQCVIYIK